MDDNSIFADGPIDDEILDYVRKNFKRAKRKGRIVIFVVNLMLVSFLTLMAWGVSFANREWIAAAVIMTVAAGIATLLHGISNLSETERGDWEIKRQLIREARLKRAMGELDDSLGEIDVTEAPEERTKRKRAHLALPDDEIDLETLGRPDADLDEQNRRTTSTAR